MSSSHQAAYPVQTNRDIFYYLTLMLNVVTKAHSTFIDDLKQSRILEIEKTYKDEGMSTISNLAIEKLREEAKNNTVNQHQIAQQIEQHQAYLKNQDKGENIANSIDNFIKRTTEKIADIDRKCNVFKGSISSPENIRSALQKAAYFTEILNQKNKLEYEISDAILAKKAHLSYVSGIRFLTKIKKFLEYQKVSTKKWNKIGFFQKMHLRSILIDYNNMLENAEPETQQQMNQHFSHLFCHIQENENTLMGILDAPIIQLLPFLEINFFINQKNIFEAIEDIDNVQYIQHIGENNAFTYKVTTQNNNHETIKQDINFEKKEYRKTFFENIIAEQYQHWKNFSKYNIKNRINLASHAHTHLINTNIFTQMQSEQKSNVEHTDNNGKIMKK
jgi:hypothetical protein